MTTLTKAQFDCMMKKLKKEKRLTASGILKEAKKKNSPLNSLFEWDDAKASHEYRLSQARSIIRRANVSIVDTEDKLVHVPIQTGKGEGEYKPVKVVVEVLSEYKVAMEEAVKRLSAAQRAVDLLHEVAQRDSPDSAAILGLAVQSLQAATTAIKQLH